MLNVRRAVFHLSRESIIGLAESCAVSHSVIRQEPAVLFNLSSNYQIIGGLILFVLGYSKQGIPDPEESAEQSMLDLAGVKSLKAFNKIWKRTVYVLDMNGTYKIYPTKRGGSGSLFLPENMIELERPDSELLGEKLLEAFELSH